MDHLFEYLELWSILSQVQLNDDVEDAISWKFAASGIYSAKSAYKAQFHGATLTSMNKTVWKIWAPQRSNSSLG